MKQPNTLSSNIVTTEKHLSECWQCRRQMHESPRATERIDAACLSGEELLTDEQVHGIIQGDEIVHL